MNSHRKGLVPGSRRGTNRRFLGDGGRLGTGDGDRNDGPEQRPSETALLTRRRGGLGERGELRNRGFLTKTNRSSGLLRVSAPPRETMLLRGFCRSAVSVVPRFLSFRGFCRSAVSVVPRFLSFRGDLPSVKGDRSGAGPKMPWRRWRGSSVASRQSSVVSRQRILNPYFVHTRIIPHVGGSPPL